MQDLSSLAKDGPWVGSAAATNTVTVPQPFSGKGTPSESTADENAGSLQENFSDTLNLNYPPGRIKGTTYSPASVSWKDTDNG